MRVPFGALDADYAGKRLAIDSAIRRVLESGRYLLGDEVRGFEQELSARVGGARVVSCANGTEAIALALAACGARPGDEVLLPANVCVPVIAGARMAGARPRLADVDPSTLTLGANEVERAWSPGIRFVIAVHLYGGLADLDGLAALSRERGVTLVEDCAQALGATWRGCPAGSFGAAAAFSFYPTKNLGAYGDAGAIATASNDVAEAALKLAQYGWSRRDVSQVEGWNSRMDELQAAILRAKLPDLDADNVRRRAIAARYDAALHDLPVTRLHARPGSIPAPHLYAIRTPRRDDLARHLADRGVGTAVHYPVPLHLQPAYAFLGYRRGDFPVSEEACETVLSLPLYPTLSEAQVDAVIEGVRGFFGAASSGDALSGGVG